LSVHTLRFLRCAFLLATVLLAVGGGFGRLVAAFLFAIVVLVLIRLLAEFVLHVQSGEHVTELPGKGVLIFLTRNEAIEIAARLVLNPLSPEIDEPYGAGWRPLSGQPLANHQCQCIVQRRFGAVADRSGTGPDIT